MFLTSTLDGGKRSALSLGHSTSWESLVPIGLEAVIYL